MSEKQKSVFDTLNAINCQDKVEKKNNLSFLPWAWAWAEVKKIYPNSNYTVYENNGVIYWHDGKTCWVKTGVTVEGLEHIEYLPVMDFKNNSIPLEKITSFDVNKAIQRSLTKALARHGLGLYIYAGEDLPEGATTDVDEELKKVNQALLKCNDLGINLKEHKTNSWIVKTCGWSKPVDIMTKADLVIYEQVLRTLIERKEKMDAEADEGA